MKLCPVVGTLLCLWISTCLTFDLTILHTNDVHARIDQSSANGGSCSDSDALAGKCYGGVARRLTKIREIRESESNVLLLDAGDQYQGTLWFYFYEGSAASRFMNKMQYDVMTFGNHEFDKEIAGVIPFLQAINFTMVSCNIDATKEPELQALFQPSVVLQVGGEKVGVVGYITPNTSFLSLPGENLVFSDEVAAITVEVQKLQGQGVNKIIALGHSGIDADIVIAKRVPGLDLVIGGHSNTFLYKGTPPDNDPKYGEYPLVIQSEVDSGHQVLVVQDYAFGKYLGYLKLTFDNAGQVTAFDGNPIILDSSIPQDAETAAEVLSMKGLLVNLTKQEAGRTRVYLEGRREVCRKAECNLGNVLTDAIVRQNLKTPDEEKWADVSIAVWNSGNIRAPIPFRPPDGIITVADVMTVLPFQNTIFAIVLSGDLLYQIFEHSVAELNDPGQFLQVSGILVTYDISKPVGKRVVSLEARCADCAVPKYGPVDKQARYKILIPSYLVGGGDGYSMIADNVPKSDMDEIGYLDTDILLDYLKVASPVTTGLERRITVLNGKTSSASFFFPPLSVVLMLSVVAVYADFSQ